MKKLKVLTVVGRCPDGGAFSPSVGCAPPGLRDDLDGYWKLDDATGSCMTGTSAQLASHMFFASGGGAWSRLLEAHPPIEERLRRLDPKLATASAA